MDPLIGGAMIGGASNAINSLLNIGQAKKEREYQKEMATTAYQRDVEMWNTQNAYNAPAAQMERLKEAGLNPNMVYGSGSATGNTSGSMPKHQSYGTPTAQMDIGGIMNVLGQYQQIKGQKLKNEEQAITNQMHFEVMNSTLDNLKETTRGLTNKNLQDEWLMGSPYSDPVKNSLFMRKHQAQTEGAEIDTWIKNIFKSSHETLPPWAKSMLPLVQSLMGTALSK